MHFAGISSTEILAVRMLNKAYLQECRLADSLNASFGEALGQTVSAAVRDAPPESLTRAAAMPFFLFDLSELTLPAPGEELQRELGLRSSESSRSLMQLALGFAQDLGRRDPFALRVVSGCDNAWAQLLGELSLTEIRAYVECSAARLQPIHAHVPGFWADWLASMQGDGDDWDALRARGLQHLIQRVAVSTPRRLAALSSKSPGKTR